MMFLKRKGFMSPQHLMVIDPTLTIPGATLEGEYKRWINAINAMTAFCLWKRGGPRLAPANLTAGLYLTTTNPVLLPNGDSISRRMRPRLSCIIPTTRQYIQLYYLDSIS